MPHRFTSLSMTGKLGQRLVDTAEIITQISPMWEIRLRTRESLRQHMDMDMKMDMESGSACTETGFGQTDRILHIKTGGRKFLVYRRNQIMVLTLLMNMDISTALQSHSDIQADGQMRFVYPACLSSVTAVSSLALLDAIIWHFSNMKDSIWTNIKVQGFFICHIINYTGYNQKWNVNQIRSTQWTVQKNKN